MKDFDGPQVLVPRDAIQWLRDKLPNVIDRTDAQRSDKSDPLFELIREGIVNAIVHPLQARELFDVVDGVEDGRVRLAESTAASAQDATSQLLRPALIHDPVEGG